MASRVREGRGRWLPMAGVPTRDHTPQRRHTPNTSGPVRILPATIVRVWLPLPVAALHGPLGCMAVGEASDACCAPRKGIAQLIRGVAPSLGWGAPLSTTHEFWGCR